ncbi:MAG TPA: hypothetical protein VH479_11025 [Acidimicrobiales bacterium]|jgi:hypothetical protein
MTTDAGSGFDNQAANRDAAANRDEIIEEESRHVADGEPDDAVGDEVGEEARERKQVHDEVNEAF